MTGTDRFEAFVREFQDMVFATAVRLLGGAAEAEDVAQTVFLRAFQRFDDIGRSPRAAGWLKRVTTNLCLNYLSRYRARWQFFSELDSHEATAGGASFPVGFENTLATPASAATDVEEADVHERLERALRRLPDHQRVPLVLFHFEEMRYDEIAAALGASVGKVKTDIHRGREALKKELTILDRSR